MLWVGVQKTRPRLKNLKVKTRYTTRRFSYKLASTRRAGCVLKIAEADTPCLPQHHPLQRTFRERLLVHSSRDDNPAKSRLSILEVRWTLLSVFVYVSEGRGTTCIDAELVTRPLFCSSYRGFPNTPKSETAVVVVVIPFLSNPRRVAHPRAAVKGARGRGGGAEITKFISYLATTPNVFPPRRQSSRRIFILFSCSIPTP